MSMFDWVVLGTQSPRIGMVLHWHPPHFFLHICDTNQSLVEL